MYKYTDASLKSLVSFPCILVTCFTCFIAISRVKKKQNCLIKVLSSGQQNLPTNDLDATLCHRIFSRIVIAFVCLMTQGYQFISPQRFCLANNTFVAVFTLASQERRRLCCKLFSIFSSQKASWFYSRLSVREFDFVDSKC